MTRNKDKTRTKDPGVYVQLRGPDLKGWQTVAAPPKVLRVKEWQVGHRQMTGGPRFYTEKLVEFEYHGWWLFLPTKAVVQYHDGTFSASAWAVDWAKERPHLARHRNDYRDWPVLGRQR